EHQGRLVKTTGDGVLVEFASPVRALRCAIDVQHGMAKRNADIPEGKRIEFRIGINLGDVVVEEDGDIFGDGVNGAARLENIAEPGTVFISRTVRDFVTDAAELALEDLGERELKNIVRPVQVFRIAPPTHVVAAAQAPAHAVPQKPSIAVLPFTNMSGDAEQEYFSDGMTEDLITDRSKVSALFVIARNSSFAYKGRAGARARIARRRHAGDGRASPRHVPPRDRARPDLRRPARGLGGDRRFQLRQRLGGRSGRGTRPGGTLGAPRARA